VLMASAVVVLKHETSTIRQRHNFIPIALTFGVSWRDDDVREVTSPDKVGSGPMNGRDNRTAHTRDPISRTIAQKTWSGLRKTFFR